MQLSFAKWHGTGNDFILVDDRQGYFPAKDPELVRRLCDRHFGIGSDGLILIQAPRTEGTDFHMEFFNPDASQSFCGNGSRCAFAFWRTLEGGAESARFSAIDGEHRATVDAMGVRVSLSPARTIERYSEEADLIHTGSPHLLVWVPEPEAVDIIPAARHYRYNDRFAAAGVNVNFLRWNTDHVEMRTYERGVEGETLSCGTGVTAAAIDALYRGFAKGASIAVHTRGGALRVDAVMEHRQVRAVDLIGPAQLVFNGTFPL